MASESDLPSWTSTLAERFRAGAGSVFVLHGNIHDLVPLDGKWLPLREFLASFLGRTKEIVLFFDVARGLQFAERKMEAPFRLAVDAKRMLERQAPLPDDLPRDPYRLFPWLETFVRDGSQHGALVLEYAETVAPNADLAFMGEQDRAMRVTLQRWSSDPGVLNSNNIILMVTENLADLDRTVRSSPRILPVEIPLPDQATRLRFIEDLVARDGPIGMAKERITDGTAGLSNFQIERLFREVREDGSRLGPERIATLKRQIIERECFGLVEFVESVHDFSVIGGMETLKAALLRVVDAIKDGERRRVPMGILLVGPMGTGKSFLMEAFANEVGMTTLKLKNFRDKWVGSTEGNLEKILNIVKAMGNVLVVIDEGDHSIGGQGGDGDGGVDSRVIARLKEFMSDTRHRGSILFAMMTNRPDKLDADMKRPGRFDLKLAFFPPQNDEERVAVIRALLKKNRIEHRLADLGTVASRCAGMTGAEIEAVLLSGLNFAEDRGAKELGLEDVEAAVADFVPSRDEAMLLYMELLAVFECSSRRMLPERYRGLGTGELNALLREHQRTLLKP